MIFKNIKKALKAPQESAVSAYELLVVPKEQDSQAESAYEKRGSELDFGSLLTL